MKSFVRTRLCLLVFTIAAGISSAPCSQGAIIVKSRS